MDIRVKDGVIEPLQYRVRCDRRFREITESYEPAWSTDADGLLAYSDAERDAIISFLESEAAAYIIDSIDQPDPDHLDLCQGAATSRSDALQALEALAVGGPVANRDIRMAQLERRIIALEHGPP